MNRAPTGKGNSNEASQIQITAWASASEQALLTAACQNMEKIALHLDRQG